MQGLNDTELSAFLLSPYLPGTQKDAREREKLDRKWRYDGVRHLSFYDVIGRLPKSDALRKPFQKVSKHKWSKSAGAAVWAENFGKAVRDLGWPGKSIDSEEFQTVEAWNTCLDDFQMLDDGEEFGDRRALKLLTRLCQSRVFQLETAATPIQIMGRLESHGLTFDTLWVTGLDSDQWPPIAVPTSFIPIQAQQAAGVPDSAPALRLELAEKEMALWMRSTEELMLCHAKMRDGLELSPALIIADKPEAKINDGNAFDDESLPDTASVIQQSASIESMQDSHGPSLAEGTQLTGGTRLLENQARCPFKAFALHRLRIKKLEEASIGIDPRESQDALLALNDEELEALINDVIAASIEKYKIVPKLQALQSRYLYRLINDWINNVERRRQPFTVVEREQELNMEIAGIGISVQVDRVDKLASGETVVLDYKTGQHNPIKTWSEPRIENPQLPLYARVNPIVEGVCFAQAFPNQHILDRSPINWKVGTMRAIIGTPH